MDSQYVLSTKSPWKGDKFKWDEIISEGAFVIWGLDMYSVYFIFYYFFIFYLFLTSKNLFYNYKKKDYIMESHL